MDIVEAFQLYNRWRFTEEARRLKAPDNYSWLKNHPDNFKKVREAFHVYCITQKILASA